ncbi:MAG: DUF2808 domain-containing protein [Xenococcaceae cyanobacterium MO_188.B32]|nr:DUF2808 domain-containing protein [Xenococcaceae cyanobacterium MO_188.B32]
MVKHILTWKAGWSNKNNCARIAAAIIAMTIVVIVPQMAICLSPVEVNRKAKEIAVRIEGSDRGSGAIISRQGNTYLVLTNWHVVEQPGNYTIQTFDGQSHSVIKKQQLIGADLAIVYFSSSDRYSVAQRGDSQYLIEGQNVYFAGYPALVGSPTYRFYAGNLIGFLSPPNQDGYELIYSGEAISGMSGSPVFDENAALIGIYGQTELEPRTGSPSLYGIPIDTVEKLSRRIGIDLGESVAVSPQPTPQPSTEFKPSSNLPLSSSESSQPIAFVGIPRLVDSTTTQKKTRIQSTYYFTIDVPDNAGISLKQIQFTQTSGVDFLGEDIHKTTGFEGTRKNRGSEFPVSLVENNKDTRTMIVSLEQPIPPGKTITIALRTYRTPADSGVYQLRVTGFPDGENARDASLGVARFHFYSRW